MINALVKTQHTSPMLIQGPWTWMSSQQVILSLLGCVWMKARGLMY